MTRRTMWLSVVACVLFVPVLAMAQEAGGGGGGGGGGRGNRNMDPAAMRERMMTGLRDQMGATEDEWKVISPKLEKLMTAQRDARAGGFGMFGGGRGGRGGNANANQPDSAVAKASQELRTALDNKDTPAADIATKLAALRSAKEKANADLQAAQKDLKEVLTQRQEAALVMMGMLE